VDPSAARKATKAQAEAQAKAVRATFRNVADEWLGKFGAEWAPAHLERVKMRLDNNAYPWIGDKLVAELEAADLLAVANRVESRGAIETAHRVLGTCGQVIRYAIATGRAKHNPVPDLRGAIRPPKVKHMAATMDPVRLGEILASFDDYHGTLTVKCALRLAPLVFVRPGELRNAQWADIDLDKAEWRFIATKTETPHVVPLSTQAVAILKEIQPLTGRGIYAFPGARSSDRPMCNVAILAAMRRLEIGKNELCGHGFRAIARTILDEVLGFRPDFIEHQLAHAVRDPNGRAYNRTAHLEARREMMQKWADYLDGLKAKR